MMKFAGVVIVASGVLLGLQGNSRAAFTVMDQIGPNASFVQGQGFFSSQIFEPSFTSFNLAVVDNFSIDTAPVQLTEVDAAVIGFNGFSSYANVTGWQVSIYSSVGAAVNSGTSLTGNIFNAIETPSQVSLTTPFGTDSFSALVQIPINVTLGLGTYYVAVMPELSFGTGGQLGVYSSTFGGTPGDSNAVQVNPGGGFGFTGNQSALGTNAAYRILGVNPAAVPEPSSVVILSTGLALVSCRLRRVRTSQS